MAAQVDLAAGGEPAQVVFLALAHGKRRLGKVVFDRDGHHLRLVEPSVHHADGGRIAGKDMVGKRINDILAHGKALLKICFCRA